MTTIAHDSQAKDRVLSLLQQLLTALQDLPDLTLPTVKDPGQEAKHISVEVAASRLDVAPNTIRRWCSKDGAPHLRIGKGPRAAIKVNINELRQWVQREFGRGEVA